MNLSNGYTAPGDQRALWLNVMTLRFVAGFAASASISRSA
jgi:hypothetical protein